MKQLTIIRGIIGMIAIIIAGLFTFGILPSEIGLPLVIIAVGVIIGFAGIEELQTDKKATGYLLIILGLFLTAYYCFRLFKAI